MKLINDLIDKGIHPITGLWERNERLERGARAYQINEKKRRAQKKWEHLKNKDNETR